MEALGVIDQLFYKADQYHVANMVMGGVSILAPARKGQSLQAGIIADHIAARLENIPLMRMKFLQDPLGLGSVHKIEDSHFDIRDHFVVSSLPAPGGYRELTTALAAVSGRTLTVSELWRWTLLDGVAGGRLAMVCQMHHALSDGLGAMQALSSMYDDKPVKPEKPAGRAEPVPDEPGPFALLRGAIYESGRRWWVKAPGFLRHNAVPLLGSLAGGVKKIIGQGTDAFSLPQMNGTSLNITRSSGARSIAYRTLSLPEIKRLARHFRCTVNDIALLLFSCAMEHYFRGIGETVEFDLQCAMPISTRTGGNDKGNQVTAGLINLHNTIEDSVARLQAIHEDTVESKKKARPDTSPIDTHALGELVPPLLIDRLVYQFARLNLMERAGGKFPVVNALLSNVPGPPGKTYIANGLLQESIPLIPAIEVLALSGGVTSVGNTITIGFHCDSEVVLNPELFVKGVDRGLAALRKTSPPTGRTRRGKRKQP